MIGNIARNLFAELVETVAKHKKIKDKPREIDEN